MRFNSHFSFCCELSENSRDSVFKNFQTIQKIQIKKFFQNCQTIPKIQNQNFQTILNIQRRYMRVSAGAPPMAKRREFSEFSRNSEFFDNLLRLTKFSENSQYLYYSELFNNFELSNYSVNLIECKCPINILISYIKIFYGLTIPN